MHSEKPFKRIIVVKMFDPVVPKRGITLDIIYSILYKMATQLKHNGLTMHYSCYVYHSKNT